MIDLTRARALAKTAAADEGGLAAELAPVLEALCAEVENARTLRVMPRSLEPFISREHHSPQRVRAFLTALGWTLFKQYDECSEWTKNVKRPGWLGEGSVVMVLDSVRFSDYAHHVAMTGWVSSGCSPGSRPLMPNFTSEAEPGDALRLAMARQHIASRASTFPAAPWDALDEHQRERALTEARHWLRAADNAGLTKRHETPDALDLHERLRLVALVMHGLAGYADACEDSGDAMSAEQIREIISEVRSVIPDTADPGVIRFEWAVRFTSVMGREFVNPMDCEGDAREVVLSVTAAEASRWALMRRTVCPWAQVFGD